MPELRFDGRPVSAPDGANLVEAGLLAGVQVPVFCYHRELGAVGACRVCAVTSTVKGRSRLVMACMTQAEAGAEVTTTDAPSVEFRRLVLEWLMENHPHDCPICDEGGECQLQDLTIAAGQGHRRFRGRKRTYVNQFLGEFIAHEMNRCITCYRCSRFYQEVAGGRDFGASGSRDRVYFGRFEPGPLESPFSGNLVELCPTGVFTDKLFRYRARVWDLEQAPSICPHCSVGCNLKPGSRHRELLRVRVRDNPEVNGAFLCDRGQFGFGWAEDPRRPRVPRVRGETSDWDGALLLTARTLESIARRHGADSIALIASPRAPLEALAALRDLAAALGGTRLAHFDELEREARAHAQLCTLASMAGAPVDQADIARCDALLVAGVSLIDEAPLAALAARNVARRGGRLFVVNPGERFLGDVAERVLSVHPAELAVVLGQLADGAGGDENTDVIAQGLRAARAPGVIAGGDLMDGRAIASAGRLAAALGDHARLGFVFPGPNGFGAAAMTAAPALADLVEAIDARMIRAAVVVESDLDRLGADRLRRLAELELLVVLDHVNGTLTDAAHVLLPAATSYESAGIFVNRAGRAQAFAPLDVAGDPVGARIRDERFPREPRLHAPRGDVRPSWWALEQVRAAVTGEPARDLRRAREALASSHPFWAPLGTLEPGSPGAPLDARVLARASAAPAPSFSRSSGLSVYLLDRTLGSETLSRRSAPMRRMAGPAIATLAPADAAALGVDGGVRLECGGATLEIAAQVRDTLPRGVVLVPRDAAWEGAIPAQGTVAQARAIVAPVPVTNLEVEDASVVGTRRDDPWRTA
jgi:NADH-quinone oxidoreductase subunit G